MRRRLGQIGFVRPEVLLYRLSKACFPRTGDPGCSVPQKRTPCKRRTDVHPFSNPDLLVP
jgi:hypothetical protein